MARTNKQTNLRRRSKQLREKVALRRRRRRGWPHKGAAERRINKSPRTSLGRRTNSPTARSLARLRPSINRSRFPNQTNSILAIGRAPKPIAPNSGGSRVIVVIGLPPLFRERRAEGADSGVVSHGRQTAGWQISSRLGNAPDNPTANDRLIVPFSRTRAHAKKRTQTCTTNDNLDTARHSETRRDDNRRPNWRASQPAD